MELERLKGELAAPSQTPAAPDPRPAASKGSISLTELRLPLKADFVCSTANKPGRLRRAPPQESHRSDTLPPGPFRSHQTLVLHHPPYWSREHGGHAAG